MVTAKRHKHCSGIDNARSRKADLSVPFRKWRSSKQPPQRVEIYPLGTKSHLLFIFFARKRRDAILSIVPYKSNGVQRNVHRPIGIQKSRLKLRTNIITRSIKQNKVSVADRASRQKNMITPNSK